MPKKKLDELSSLEKTNLLKLLKKRNAKHNYVARETIPCTERTEHIPLSYAQQRLWFLAQSEKIGTAYHIQRAFRLRGQLDLNAFRCALDSIVKRHESLRTTFKIDGKEATQKIAPAENAHFYLTEDMVKNTEELEQLLYEEAKRAFDLEQGPLIRGLLIKEDENIHVFLIVMHHIVSDGWSMAIFIRELNNLYASYANGKENCLEPIKIQYADYAVWQRKWIAGKRLDQQAKYWQKELSSAPTFISLPTDYLRPAKKNYTGSVVEFSLSEKLSRDLKKLSTQHDTT